MPHELSGLDTRTVVVAEPEVGVGIILIFYLLLSEIYLNPSYPFFGRYQGIIEDVKKMNCPAPYSAGHAFFLSIARYLCKGARHATNTDTENFLRL